MARKRFVFFCRVSPILKLVLSKARHRVLVLSISAFFGLVSTLNIPVLSVSLVTQTKEQFIEKSVFISQAVDALQLAQRGQTLYNAGQFDEAAQVWQQAADAYTAQGDAEGMLQNLTNKSQALQSLGFSIRACNTLLQAFGINNADCKQLNLENQSRQKQPGYRNQATPPLQEQLDSLINTLDKQQSSLSLTQAIGLRYLGDIFRRIGNLEHSEKFLTLSLKVAEQLQSSFEVSNTLLDLANTERALANRERTRKDPVKVASDISLELKFDQAKGSNTTPVQTALAAYNGYYKRSLNSYERAASPLASPNTRIQAELNHLSLLLDIKQGWKKAIEKAAKNNPQVSYGPELERYLIQKIEGLLPKIYSDLKSLTLDRRSIYTMLNLADILTRQELAFAIDNPVGHEEVELLLANTVHNAHTLGDKRAEAYAIGYQGKLLEQQASGTKDPTQQRLLLDKARYLTEQALRRYLDEATNTDIRDVAYRLEWQLGRILQAQHDAQGGKAAYEAAFQHLKFLRKDIAAINQDVQFLFQDEVEPIYREFIGLLLQPNTPSSDNDILDIEKARNVVEALKLAELDNYFQDPCAETKNVKIDEFVDKNAPSSAIIYPIVLESPHKEEIQLKLILKLPQQKKLRLYTTSLTKREFETTLDELYQTLYIEAVGILKTQIPLKKRQEDLESRQKKVLPLLKEVYNWLIKPLEADLAEVDTLVFVADGQLQNIPMAALYNGKNYLIQKYNIALSPSLQLTDTEPLPRKNLKVLAAGVSGKSQGRDPLPSVKKELDEIKSLLPDSIILHDENFTQKNLQEKLSEFSFPIVHLATHGQFSSNSEETWILTFDDRIYVNDFDNLLQRTDKPDTIGLLVLSSCETAQGDRRAVLGLAGAAVRTGASSTLATLWQVEDSTAAKLMGNFYRELKKLADDPTVTKASALRHAQLELLENSPYNHPVFWAPYVLVGNWL